MVHRTRIRRGLTAAAAVAALALVASAAFPQTDLSAGGSYRIGAGDELHIVVWRNEDLTMTIPVRPDGWISLPLVNDLEVAGLTPMEVRARLTEKLSPFVSSPLVSVIVTRVGSFKVSVLGNVRRPGRFDLEGAPTVLDVIAIAGGPDEFANKNEIYVLRPGRAGFQRFPVGYSETIKAESGSGTTLFVAPGDLIIVP